MQTMPLHPRFAPNGPALRPEQLTFTTTGPPRPGAHPSGTCQSIIPSSFLQKTTITTTTTTTTTTTVTTNASPFSTVWSANENERLPLDNAGGPKRQTTTRIVSRLVVPLSSLSMRTRQEHRTTVPVAMVDAKQERQKGEHLQWKRDDDGIIKVESPPLHRRGQDDISTVRERDGEASAAPSSVYPVGVTLMEDEDIKPANPISRFPNLACPYPTRVRATCHDRIIIQFFSSGLDPPTTTTTAAAADVRAGEGVRRPRYLIAKRSKWYSLTPEQVQATLQKCLVKERARMRCRAATLSRSTLSSSSSSSSAAPSPKVVVKKEEDQENTLQDERTGRDARRETWFILK